MSFIEKWTAQGETKRHALFLDLEREYREAADNETDNTNRSKWLAGADNFARRAKYEKSISRNRNR